MIAASRFFAVVMLAGLSMAAQTPTFKSTVEAVRVDVLVTKDGRPVPGLTSEDFEVYDNGVAQLIDRTAFEEMPLNLILALDASSSVEGERAVHLRAACHAVLDRLRRDEQAALVTFSDAVMMRASLMRDLSAVRAGVDRPLPLGDTSLIDASYAALLLAESQPGRSLVIVFTDGVEVSSYLEAATVLEAVKRSDAVIYGVTLKSTARPPFLDRLTDASGGSVMAIESAARLDDAFARVLEQFRHRYLFSYTPRGVDPHGWHRLQVRVKRQGVAVKARPGYFRN